MKNILITLRVLVTLIGIYFLFFNSINITSSDLLIGMACLLLASNTIVEWDLPSSTKSKEDHKIFLLGSYHTYLTGWSVGTFYHIMYKEAIRKLNADVNPQYVEDWVVKLEKSWNNIK